MAGAIPYLLAAGATYYAAKQQKKATEAAAKQVGELAEPGLAMQEWAFPLLQQVISQQYLGELGMESPYSRAAHEQAIEDIRRGGQRAEAESQAYWTRSGNIGRGRGERFRISRDVARNLAAENIRYGQQRETAEEEQARAALNALLAAAGMGTIDPSMMAIQMGLQAKTGYYGDLAGGVGSLLGYYEASQQRKREEKFLRDIGKSIGGGGST